MSEAQFHRVLIFLDAGRDLAAAAPVELSATIRSDDKSRQGSGRARPQTPEHASPVLGMNVAVAASCPVVLYFPRKARVACLLSPF